jgi:hypothetical protein
MLDIIRKKEFFEWCEQGVIPNLKQLKELREKMAEAWFLMDIKSAQDGWVLSMIGNAENMKVAEVGGSESRVLPVLNLKNECWNIDRLEGADGGGHYRASMSSHTRVVRSHLGEFSRDIPDNYFDYVFSISVIEHLPASTMADFFMDMARIMRPGGKAFHAIDFYISDVASAEVAKTISALFSSARAAGLVMIDSNKIDAENLSMKSDYATHSDMGLMGWNLSAPGLKTKRESHQVVAVKCGWLKLA